MKAIIICLTLFASCFANDYYKGKEAIKIWHDAIIAKAEARKKREAAIAHILGIPVFGAVIGMIIHSIHQAEELKKQNPRKK